MITDTSARILEYIKAKKQAKVVDLVREMGITNAAIHRQLNKLIRLGAIMKVGRPPVVLYILKEKEKLTTVKVPEELEEFIDKNYIYVSPAGEYLIGAEGFTRWVQSINQDKYLVPLAHEYVKVRKEADDFININGWIDATGAKEQAVFGSTVLNKLLYRDFYSIEKFGKTRLGQMVLYAKMSQNTKIIEAIAKEIKPVIERIIREYKIDTIAYVPPSVKRKIQLMMELKKRLNIQLAEVSLIKAYTGDVIVSQKSLSKFQERVINAKSTIFVDVNKSVLRPKNILLIDDAVGSGATMHETAVKIRDLLDAKGIIVGFAIVGSIKGFEVIREI